MSWIGPAVVWIAAAPAPAPGQELAAQRAVFVEWALPRAEAWQGEFLRVGVRFGLEERFLAERLVQPFRRELDVPVRLLLPGLAEDECLRATPAQPDRGLEFGLDEAVGHVREIESLERDGVRLRVFEHELELRPSCVGEFALPAPQLVLTTAESFRTDIFGNRTPVEPIELVRTGTQAALHVRALPEESRPEGFSGGVGTFALSAAVRSERVTLGQGFLFDLIVEGHGDLDAIEPPRLEGLTGLRVRGQLENLEPERLTWTYELVPASDAVRAVPGIELSVFDPEAGAWRTLVSPAVPIEVLSPEPETDSADGAPAATTTRTSRLAWLALPALALALLWWRRRPPRSGPSPALARAHAAHVALTGAPGDGLARYTAFLAAFLDCAPPAVVGARLAERLLAAGAPDGLARRLARHHDELTGVRYGGRAAGPDGEAEALADELLAALR